MPVEGQWARANAPVRALTGRERRAFRILLALTALAGVALIAWALARGGDTRPGAGCISEFTGSTMGGVRVQACGADAARVCRNVTTPQRLVTACRRAGYSDGRSVKR